ncbi:respiratory nitrate reductase subunit gamma [Mesobacillus maritimus]|uniref:respiratory nitrate reductase subunit gamma n=1 Tax=Mesobacillus maritimus TaxID=1643336 RepID=UPI00203A7611|nr:respiratory nitrate reductase subunit gamma [Mesobacillus maritimus]MCM3667453.1 respiratory nitrate reductase subunit gamma [Mesobacillus maritimus]
MEIDQILLWIVFPYSVVAVVGMSLIWQLEANGTGSKRSTGDRILTGSLKWLFVLGMLTGLVVTHFYQETAQLYVWGKSLIQLQPDMSVINNISFLSQVHVIIVFSFLLGLAFSSHIRYLMKPHLYIKALFSNFVAFRDEIMRNHFIFTGKDFLD